MNATNDMHDHRFYRWRVLVVDNDPIYRQDVVKNLRLWGYEVFMAAGGGRELLDDARKKAKDYRCHIALVDMRLLDDDDRNDMSGLDLIPDLKPTRSLIVSAYGDRETVVKAWQEKEAVNFVGKEQGPEQLYQAIHKAIQDVCLCDLNPQWYPGYEPQDILRKLDLNDSEIPVDEPVCVLGHLYAGRDISLLDLRPIAEYYRSPEDMTPLVRSVVFVARARDKRGDWHQPEIVKLALRERIEEEIQNYRKYVEPLLPHDRTARIEDKRNAVILWDVGGIRYTNIATEDRRPLRQWYTSVEVESVKAALEDLFKNTLRPWYERNSDPTNGFVYSYYVDMFPKLGPRIDEFDDQRKCITMPGILHDLRNPVVWARDHCQQSRFISRWDAYTHGDLHSENIFVGQHNQTRVIDYERSGPGYYLRDFVELEADIRLRLLRLTQDELILAYHLDRSLLAPEHPDQSPVWKDIPVINKKSQGELRKAFEAISALRQLAFQFTRFERMDEYYWALLMETLISVVRNYSTWKDQQAAKLAKDRAILSAALLCERLARWGDSWPPEEWLYHDQVSLG